ncbi:hypothetical protein LVJ82_03430 [Vitreoscilla massiliensis]|uniref:Uncharacterized protein n=1 Tax=Vitreoscilla massiliensis TaxID=1689272 RepID=A0ABY4E2Q2_9NEIS|nr:hypothetical protein [Vitreoscilla massiliensis]UOO90054.1 hypothetical protein LVJ82_03430 [Vitreoscilla massiliensis]
MTSLRTIGVCLVLATSACQPQQQQGSSSAHPASQPRSSAAATAKTPLPPQCDNIPLQMSAITANSDLQSLSVVNLALKRCVPLVKMDTRKLWLEASWDMYQRFLKLGGNSKNSLVWDEFSGILEGYPDESSEDKQARLQRQAELWPRLTPRMQQMSLWQGKEYIDNYYIGEGEMALRRHPRFIVDIFSPYLPEDEQVFSRQLAKENTTLTTNDAALVIPWSEVSNRALFWERYLKRYPKSPYVKQAQFLFQWYQAILFQGLDNTPVLEADAKQLNISADAMAVHQALTKKTGSSMAAKSSELIQWLQQQQQRWPQMSASEHAGFTAQRQQLYKKLKVGFPNPVSAGKNSHYDCFTDALCHISKG